jgi:hypothetical protein
MQIQAQAYRHRQIHLYTYTHTHTHAHTHTLTAWMRTQIPNVGATHIHNMFMHRGPRTKICPETHVNTPKTQNSQQISVHVHACMDTSLYQYIRMYTYTRTHTQTSWGRANHPGTYLHSGDDDSNSSTHQYHPRAAPACLTNGVWNPAMGASSRVPKDLPPHLLSLRKIQAGAIASAYKLVRVRLDTQLIEVMRLLARAQVVVVDGWQSDMGMHAHDLVWNRAAFLESASRVKSLMQPVSSIVADVPLVPTVMTTETVRVCKCVFTSACMYVCVVSCMWVCMQAPPKCIICVYDSYLCYARVYDFHFWYARVYGFCL